MAARKSASDINNGPISYLDDVPFKINDRFRCPAKVGLPIGFCLPDCNGVQLLADMQYDFSLERRSVRWGVELAEAHAAEGRAEEAAARQEAEEYSSQDADSGGGKRPRPAAEDQEPPPPALNPVLAGLSNAILTPLPAGPAQKTEPVTPVHCLNLADFEREEDPFDKLELKTLNDKEELRSILQSQPQPPPAASPPEITPPLGPASRGNSPSPPSTNTSLSAKPGFAHKPNGLVALLDMDRAAGPGRGGAPDTDDRPCNIRSLSFPKLSDPGDNDRAPLGYSPLSVPCPAPRRNITNGSPPALPNAHVIVSPELPGHTKNGAPKQTVLGAGPAALPCGGALLSLTPSERQCVETIVGMGYSYEGVLRAMQRQGQNVEQVLDYLFVHSRLCERGFDATAVEECLEMYQCSEEKALQFLELMSRFGEMGFERDAIKEVLLVHNNDQDKALEDLMARPTAS